MPRKAIHGIVVTLLLAAAAWSWADAPALTLTPDATCYTTQNGTVTVDVVLTQSAPTDEVLGGLFFLAFDDTTLTFVGITYGDSPFTRDVYDPISNGTNGEITYAVGLPEPPPAGYTGAGPLTMARVTFQATAEACEVSDLVSFRDPGAPFATRLTMSDGLGGAVPLEIAAGDLHDLGAITLDWTDPTLSGCPTDVTVECNTVPPPATVNASDNCPGVLLDFDEQRTDGSCEDDYTLTRTWTATDACGNTDSCTQIVTVQDTTDPVISGCPTDITVNNDPGLCSAVVSWTPPTATDNCDADPSLLTTHAPGTVFPLGVTPVTYTATDNCGNDDTCSFNVTVNDNEDPAITTCPPDRTLYVDADCETTVPDLTGEVVASDNCDTNLDITQNPTAGSTIGLGGTVVTITFTDDYGNDDTCDVTLTVVDDIDPEITTCPPDRTLHVDAICETTVPDLTGEVAADDNCDTNLDITQNPTAGTTIGLGGTVVTITVTDDYGNDDTCDVTLTVVDDIDPEITTCPPDRTLYVDANCETTVPDLTGEVVASDNCDTNLDITQNPTAGTTIGLGGTVVTITVSDDYGNDDTCDVTLTVEDNTPPTVTDCPADITQDADPGAVCEAEVTWTAPTVADNCDTVGPTVVYEIDLGDNGSVDDTIAGTTYTFPAGTHRVTVVATDSWNNVNDDCDFAVTIEAYNELLVNVQLQPTMAAAVTRCITFTFYDCDGFDWVLDVNIDFDATGLGSAGLSDLLVCGDYDCVLAQDGLHTLTVRLDRDDLGLDFYSDGSGYVANFTGGNQLINGDLYDDTADAGVDFIDIVDFGVFIATWGSIYDSDGDMDPDGHTPCHLYTVHGDIDGDGSVDGSEFAFISYSFLMIGDIDCCGAPTPEQGPRDSVTISELVERIGLMAMRADLNGDDLLDLRDVQLFLQGTVPEEHEAEMFEEEHPSTDKLKPRARPGDRGQAGGRR